MNSDPDPNSKWNEEEGIVWLTPREMMATALIIREWQDMPNKPIQRSDEFKKAILSAKKKLFEEANKHDSGN